MTGDIFHGWLKRINKEMKTQKRQIVLFLDNATSHGSKDIHLSNVTLKYLPANTTSTLQPLDQGIRKSFKSQYSRQLMSSLVTHIETAANALELCKALTILDAINWLAIAWRDVKATTISKCFRKAGFGEKNVQEEVDDEEDDIPLARLANELQAGDVMASLEVPIPTEENSGDWERDLLDNFCSNRPTETSDEEDEDNEDDNEEVTPADRPTAPTLREILEFSARLKVYATDLDDCYLNMAYEMENVTNAKIIESRCAKKQTTLDSFFLKK